MPWGNRTGPVGIGPLTERQAGCCVGFSLPGFANMDGSFPNVMDGGSNRVIAGLGQATDYVPTDEGAAEGLVADITNKVLDFILGREAEKTAQEQATAQARRAEAERVAAEAALAQAGRPSWVEANAIPLALLAGTIGIFLFTRKR